MYAVVQSGGKQHKVTVGQTVMVELGLEGAGEAGGRVELDQVLAIGGDGGTTIGTPTIPGARVVTEVVDPDAKGKKLIVFKYKPKVRYRRKTGHRQHYTKLKVTEIVSGSITPGTVARAARDVAAATAATAASVASAAVEAVKDALPGGDADKKE